MDNRRNRAVTLVAVIGSILVLLVLVLSTLWIGQSARGDTQEAVRSVSLLYLDELAGRREQVIAGNLQGRIRDLETALELMSEDDLSSKSSLESYQAKMKRYFTLERFAFVDTEGLIYTSTGTQNDIGEYDFDYKNLTGPQISIKNLNTTDKKVIIAVPVTLSFEGKKLIVCFMEIDMDEMLNGISMQAQEEAATFCNIYTHSGIALSNTVLGGLAVEDNLLEAMKNAQFENGYSYESFIRDFDEGNRGVVSFTYNGIRETLSYVPVDGTDWLLTYLIRESVISNQISAISDKIIKRSVIQSIGMLILLLAIFGIIIQQIRRNNLLRLEKEASDTENRIRQQELEQRLALQEKLLAEQQQSQQQEKLITALASDYWSVYYVELDSGKGICYQAHSGIEDGLHAGDEFDYKEQFHAYAERYVTESYRSEFLRFADPETIRKNLKENRVISYTYMVNRKGKELYETIRFAGVRHPEDRDDGIVHAIGASIIDADRETRENLDQRQALSDALNAAEDANRAKTVFLSNMSHEIRTPMNAIIGLDNIALNDPDISDKTRGYLKEIGSSAEHLLNLINDILDMSRIESGRLTLRKEEFSLPKLLEAINTMFAGQCRERGLTYSCEVKGDVNTYYIGDDMKLRQVLINILGNAVKFTPEGGSVTLITEGAAHFDNHSTLRFVIKDNGIGMSKDYLPHIFDTFSQEDSSNTSKYGSSGLGLAITKNIVEMMNGTIEVESEKGKGTTFIVSVTLLDGHEEEEETGAMEIRPSEMVVLVVDDDPIACEHAKVVLGNAGIDTEVASSGEKAVEMVRLRHTRMEPYNLILVDWKMPEMDGVETTRRIREIIGNESAIIILTAYRFDEIIDEAKSAGVDTFISKPLFAGSVIEEFRKALDKRGTKLSSQKEKADLRGRRILLAEDVDVNADIMMMVLEMREMSAERAENGRIALEMFESHEPGYYDAILMDMRMPEMDGLEATRRIRALKREDAASIPIVALTANAFDEDVQRSLQAGLNAHLSKPVQPETLFETLETLL